MVAACSRAESPRSRGACSVRSGGQRRHRAPTRSAPRVCSLTRTRRGSRPGPRTRAFPLAGLGARSPKAGVCKGLPMEVTPPCPLSHVPGLLLVLLSMSAWVAEAQTAPAPPFTSADCPSLENPRWCDSHRAFPQRSTSTRRSTRRARTHHEVTVLATRPAFSPSEHIRFGSLLWRCLGITGG